MDASGCDHETRVNGASNDPPQGVPRSLIEPIQKIVKSMFDHVGRGSVVEPENEVTFSRK